MTIQLLVLLARRREHINSIKRDRVSVNVLRDSMQRKRARATFASAARHRAIVVPGPKMANALRVQM